MRALAFVDIHARFSCIKPLLQKSKHADFLICAGDLSNFGQGLKKLAFLLAAAKKKILTIHGNHEDSEDIDKLASCYPFFENIHRKIYRIHDIAVVGFGGGGFAFEDNKMDRFFRDVHWKLHKERVILVTHAPPYGKKVDFIPGVGHRGCISVTRGIKLLQPAYAIAGHLHETAGTEDRVGKTTILNPGWTGRLIEL